MNKGWLMKPSDIVLLDPVPLTAVFGRTEKEIAAAYLILTMRELRNAWEAIRPIHISIAVTTFKERAGYTWLTNPFCRPDFHALVDEGFAEWVDFGNGEEPKGLMFTDKGLEALQQSRWVPK